MNLLFLISLGFGIVLTVRCEKVVPLWLSSFMVGDNPLFGYRATAPVFDVALDRARLLYPRVFQAFTYSTFFSLPNFSTCEQSVGYVLELFSNIYNTSRRKYEDDHDQRRLFIISPGCSDQIAQLGDMAREMDIPFIATTTSDGPLTDDVRYPTVIASGASAASTIAQAILEILKQHQWNRVSFISDLMLSEPVYSVVLAVTDKFVRDCLTSPMSGVNTVVQNIDSTNWIGFEGEIVLRNAAAHSSVVLMLSGSTEVYCAFLELAVRLQMATGKFVFILIQSNQLPFYQGTILDHENQLKNRTPSILPFVFEVTTVPKNLTGYVEDSRRISDRSRQHYNYSVPADYEFGTIQLSAYDSTLVLAQVMNETYDMLDNMTGSEFITHFRNRTFRTTTGPLTINSNRNRVVTVVIKRYIEAAGEFKITWTGSGREKLLLADAEINWGVQWKGQPFPPSADPFCGQAMLSGGDCSPSDASSYSNLAFLFVPALAVFAIPFLRKKYMLINNKWWDVELSEIDFDLVGNGQPPFRLAIKGLAVNQISLDGREVVYENGLYRGEVIQVVRFAWDITSEDVVKNKHLLSVLQQVKNLDHPNIARFYGLSFVPATKASPRQWIIITESPKKGFLRDLIDSDNLAFNWALRISLIWDIIRGLRYIHGSPLKYHGCLCLVNLIIDEHFTLKITRNGAIQMYGTLKTDSGGVVFAVPRIMNLWMAPEAVDVEEKGVSVQALPSAASDMFSLGVILYEVASRNIPFEVETTDLAAIKRKIREIRSGQLDVDAYPMAEDTPPEVVQQIKQCWAFNPADRPTITKVARMVNHLHPNSNISVAEGILRRLEQYNQELEATVLARKEALNLEMEKVDSLLRNILPKCIVQRLRNGEEPMPEYFESVTILFSDIPTFNHMVANCSPFSIVDLLHRLYSGMDDIIAQHEVYKVETIKDSYMVASGLPQRNGERHAMEIGFVALKFLEGSQHIAAPDEYKMRCPHPKLRIGINTGPCVAAVIGQKQPRYCLVGDTINTASRMETHGEEQKIHLTDTTKVLLDPTMLFRVQERGLLSIKGKGEMTTYWLEGLA